MERVPRLRQPMGCQMRSFHPTTHQRLPPMTSSSPSTFQGIKGIDHSPSKQQWPATNTTLAPIRNMASFPDFTFPQESWLHPISIPPPSYVVRLKLAFCTTCAVRVLVLAQGPSFLRLRRALLGRRGDSQDERSATITSGGVETIQRSCSTSTEEIEVVWK